MSLPTDRPRVFSHITRTRFLHIEDSLNHNKKLRLFVGSFERGQGASSTAYTFLDMDDARVVLNDLSWGRAVDFADFKGGQDSNGRIISRVLKIQSKEDKVWLEVHNGEGEALFGGVIKPHGQPYAEISVPLTIWEARKMAYATLSYMLAWEVAQMVHSTGPGR